MLTTKMMSLALSQSNAAFRQLVDVVMSLHHGLAC
jgi:hypothetical protein